MIWQVLLVLGIASAGLFGLGVRGRRIPTGPSCRRCRFSLVGIYPGQTCCPECGIAFDRRRRVRTSRRVVRLWLVVPSGALLLLCASAAGYRLGLENPDFQIEIKHHKPAKLLCLENKYGDDERAGAALQEMQRRLRAGELTTRGMRSIARYVLAIQADEQRKWETHWGDFMETARRKGLLEDSYWARYMIESYRPTITPRAAVNIGDPVPFRIHDHWRVGNRPGFEVALIVGDAVLGDDIPASHDAIGEQAEAEPLRPFVLRPSSHSTSFRVISEFRYSQGPNPVLPRPEKSGRTVFRVPLRLEFYEMSGAGQPDPVTPGNLPYQQLRRRSRFITSQTRMFETPVHILPDEVPGLRLLDDPALGEQLEEYLNRILRGPPSGIDVAAQRRRLGRFGMLERPPAPIAFVVYAREGLKEERAGSAGLGWWTTIPESFELARVDLILRPDLERAKQTIEMTEIWGGEIILRDVVVDGWQRPHPSVLPQPVAAHPEHDEGSGPSSKAGGSP